MTVVCLAYQQPVRRAFSRRVSATSLTTSNNQAIWCQRDAAMRYYLCAMDWRTIMLAMALILVGCVTAKVLLAPTPTHVLVDCRVASRC